jgi:hypothetical protein
MLPQLVAAEPLTRNSSNLKKKLHWFKFQCWQIFFICFKLTNTELNCAVTHQLINYTFQMLPLLQGLEM